MDRPLRRNFSLLPVILFLAVPALCFGQDSNPAGPEEDKPLRFFPINTVITEKVVSDLSAYRNGVYTEHVRREERGRLSVSVETIRGRYYILENAVRNAVRGGNRVDKTVSVEFPAAARPAEWVREEPYPRFRPFPSFTNPPPRIGATWKEILTVTVFPEHSGNGLVLPAEITYRYDGTEIFQGKKVHRTTGSLRLDIDPAGSPAVRNVTGTHELTLLYDTSSGAPLFIRDRLEDTYTFRNGDEIRYRGFVNHWISYPALLEDEEAADFKGLDMDDVEDVIRVETEEGPALRLHNLRFRPDLAELLDNEELRLERIAETLHNATEGTILVAGHAADTGNPSGEKRLSLERARTITEELIARGVDSGRLIYEGRGSTEPIAPNDTDEGRARNRRVEIILLEE